MNYTIEVSEEHLQYFIRHVRNTISHFERHGPNIPARKARLEGFRGLLKQLEEAQQ